MEIFKTRPIGEKFVLKTDRGIYLMRVTKTTGENLCEGCAFSPLPSAHNCAIHKRNGNKRGECIDDRRSDRTNVIYKILKFKPYGEGDRK